MNDLLLYGGKALTMDSKGTIIDDAVLEIRGGVIASIRSESDYAPPKGVRAICARGCLVLPGLVNGHTHAGMSLLRGIADDLPLDRWLREVIFPLEKKWGSEAFVELGARLSAVEMIRSGTTTLNDMYYFEESAAKAFHEAGLRAVCGQTIVEISGVEQGGPDLFGRFDQFLEEIARYPLIRPAIAPHSIYGVSDQSWRKVVDYVDKHGLTLHLHLAETEGEMEQCLKTYGTTPTEYFDGIGLWSQRVIAAHATCVTPREIEILGRNRVGVVHNPQSNLKLGTRICPVTELRQAGARVALGTDGVASNNDLDLLQEADTCAKLQIFRKGIGMLKAEEIVRMLTVEGAAAVGLGDLTGSLEPGKAADAIAIDLDRAHLVPIYDPYSHLIYCAKGSDVKHSIVAGKVLMEDHCLKTLDERSILEESVRWGKRIAEDKAP